MMDVKDLNFLIMIEEDKAENDSYIPALRLEVKGDSLEEVKENARLAFNGD